MQLGHGKPNTRFDGSEGQAEQRGDLSVRFIGEESQAQHFGLFGWQPSHRRAQAIAVLGRGDEGVRLFDRLTFLTRQWTSLSPGEIDAQIAGDREYPRRWRRPHGVELRRSPPDGKEGLLRELFGSFRRSSKL